MFIYESKRAQKRLRTLLAEELEKLIIEVNKMTAGLDGETLLCHSHLKT
jgi:hypothetical protein